MFLDIAHQELDCQDGNYKRYHHTDHQDQHVLILVIGMVVAFVVSILAIKFLMGYIKKHDFKAFGWYRIVLGALVLVYFIGKTLLA